MNITYLILVINQDFGCAAIHKGTLQPGEISGFKSVWSGPVEVFQLVNHPKAAIAYAWRWPEAESRIDVAALLEIPRIGAGKAPGRTGVR